MIYIVIQEQSQNESELKSVMAWWFPAAGVMVIYRTQDVI